MTANNFDKHTFVGRGDPTSLEEEFAPRFDDDGNQTLIKTATGIWQVHYNGENRPILWQCVSTNSLTPNSSTPSLISMSYDRMGRRVTKNSHRIIYDGYLCIKRINAAPNNAIDLIFTWDPSKRIATRPLIIEMSNRSMLYITHDGNKNVTDLVFGIGGGGVAAHYEYAPFGAIVVVPSHFSDLTSDDFCTSNPLRFSSEYADDALGLIYYNHRHYNGETGCWTGRDPLDEFNTMNLYNYVRNSSKFGKSIYPARGYANKTKCLRWI